MLLLQSEKKRVTVKLAYRGTHAPATLLNEVVRLVGRRPLPEVSMKIVKANVNCREHLCENVRVVSDCL